MKVLCFNLFEVFIEQHRKWILILTTDSLPSLTDMKKKKYVISWVKLEAEGPCFSNIAVWDQLFRSKNGRTRTESQELFLTEFQFLVHFLIIPVRKASFLITLIKTLRVINFDINLEDCYEIINLLEQMLLSNILLQYSIFIGPVKDSPRFSVTFINLMTVIKWCFLIEQ